MDDENELPDVETRVRAAVNPPASVVERVVARALTDNDRPPRDQRRRRVAIAIVASAVLLIALSIWQGSERTQEYQVPTSRATTGDGSLLVVSLAAQTASPADPLKSRVTIEMRNTPLSDFFRALAAAMDVPVTVDPGLSGEPNRNWQFKNAQTADVLNMLCAMHNCQWDFDAVRGMRVMRKR